ncbi:putative PPM-type phosphatase domain, protein phosphatase 2C family [Helianthus anomalus]
MHLVGKRVKKVMQAYLFHYWQEAMAQCSILMNGESYKNVNFDQFGMWNKGFLKACSTIDYDLELHPVIECFYNGTAALTIIRKQMLVILELFEGQLQTMAAWKPRGYISSEDERGVSRFRVSNAEEREGPGLALSRAFGNFFVKDFGLISEPDVIQTTNTKCDRFVILATDGV